MKLMRERLGLEAIDFQSKNFGKEIELAIELIRSENLDIDRANKSKYKKNLVDIIKRHTNMTIFLEFIPYDENSIYTNILNINSSLYDEYENNITEKELKKYGEKIKQIGDRANYSIDLKTGKVSGLIGELPQQMFLDYPGFVNNHRYTPAEVTATILHELGHAFTTLEFSTRIVSTNQALAAIFYSIANNNPPDRHLTYLRSAATDMGLNQTALDDIVEIKNNTIISSIIVDRGIFNVKSELGTRFYDTTTMEYLADQYLSRYGYGVHFASRMNKYYKGTVETSTLARTIVRVIETLTGILFVLIGVGLFSIAAIAGFIYLAACITAMITDGKSSMERMTYDNLINRYKRINEQTIERLKNRKINKDEVNELIINYNKVKGYIEKTQEFKPIYETVLDFMFKSRRDGIAAMKLQRELEELASNSLFVKSAQLKVLSK